MALPGASTHLHIVKFEVHTAVTLKISFSRVVAPCSKANIYQHQNESAASTFMAVECSVF
jgi:hypothetical protein